MLNTHLLKGGAVLEDMRILVRSWDDSRSSKESKIEVVDRNILGKKTRKRAKDVYEYCFVPRFIKGDPAQAWKLVRVLEDKNLPLDLLKPVYYWITARSEPIIYKFVVEKIFPKSKEIATFVNMDETMHWIKDSLLKKERRWSDSVIERIASGLLSTLRDFGILTGKVKKQIAPVYLPIESFSYIAFILHRLGVSAERLISHSDWKLFLLTPQSVEHLFLEAHRMKLLQFNAAGNIYRIEFYATTPEEMADVIAKRSF